MPGWTIWICPFLAILVVVLYSLLLKWKKWGQDYDKWIQANCACPNPDEEPPQRPPFP